MEELGHIIITAKNGWENVWNMQPSFISYNIDIASERIFSCYYSKSGNQVQITNLEALKLISDDKAMVDAYLFLAIKGLIRFTNNIGAKRLVVDSFIPAAADHMLDLGFYVVCKGLSNGSRGCKTLEA